MNILSIQSSGYPTDMWATRARYFLCSGSGLRSGQSTLTRSPITPVMAIRRAQFTRASRSGSWWTGSRLGARWKGAMRVLTGYVGGADIGDAILHAVTSVRRAKPEALIAAIRVIGNSDTGVYVRPGVRGFFWGRRLCRPLMLATPNRLPRSSG